MTKRGWCVTEMTHRCPRVNPKLLLKTHFNDEKAKLRVLSDRAYGCPANGTLSSSENSILSSRVQLRPMGEMFSMPFRNSMKVPLG